MSDAVTALRAQVARQVAHWRVATAALGDLESFASASAWSSLEQYLGLALRSHLTDAVGRLGLEADALAADLRAARTGADLEQVRRRVIRFRHRYLQTETVMDFYGDAVNTRTNPHLAALLSACDAIAVQGMTQVLKPLGLDVPPVLTYLEKGMGAAITRFGLRLWDEGSLSPVAAIKITRHNLRRPTSLVHEIGHQIAHQTSWTPELATAIRARLGPVSPPVADAWVGWTSEVNADAFAFAHTGYASVAALHDVVAGEDRRVFSLPIGDPHPVPYLRVLLGARMCARAYGPGPWDDLTRAWIASHPLRGAPEAVRALIEGSLEHLGTIVDLCLFTPMRAFGGRPLAALVDPLAVSPDRLTSLDRDAQRGMDRSTYWLWQECTRLLALTGYKLATAPELAARLIEEQEAWMVRLGTTARAAA